MTAAASARSTRTTPSMVDTFASLPREARMQTTTTCPTTWSWRRRKPQETRAPSGTPSGLTRRSRRHPEDAERRLKAVATLTRTPPSPWPSPPRSPPTSSWTSSWLWLTLVLVALLARPATAFCPQGCVCNTLRIACENAGLDVVPFQLNPEAHTLTLRGNNILTLEYTVNFYQQLQSLDLSQNRLQSLGSKNFDALERLGSLNVSGNEISTFSKDAFKGLRKLRVLDLSDNLIENLERNMFAEMHDLWELHLRRNRLGSIKDGVLNSLANLRVLQLSDNQLLGVPTEALARLTSLRGLALSGNLIEELGGHAFANLRELSVLTLDGNLISNIHADAFDGLVSLESLDLSDNNITAVPGAGAPLSKLRRLSYLDLSNNMFSSLGPAAFHSLAELRVLKLNRLVKLTRVDGRAFADNKRLESVSLEANEDLRTLPTRLFHGSPLLSRVSVRGSALTSLEAAHFPLDRLQTLDVAEVPLTCNCSLLWLWLLCREQRQHVIASNETAAAPTTAVTPALSGPEPSALSLAELHPIVDLDKIRCAGPADLRGFALVDVPEAEVRCEATWMAVVMVTVVVLALFAATCTVLFFLSSGRWCGHDKDASDVSTDSFATQHSHKHHGTLGGTLGGLPSHPALPGGQVMMLPAVPSDMKVEPTYATIGMPNGRHYGDYKKETDHLMNVNAYQRALNNWDSSFNGNAKSGLHHSLTMGRHADQIRHGGPKGTANSQGGQGGPGSYGTYHNQNHNHYSMAIDMTKKPPHIVYV